MKCQVIRRLIGATVFAMSLAALPAAAQTCPIAQPNTIWCYVPATGCSQYRSNYYCSGYGNLQTCGGPSSGPITCCGYVIGVQPWNCGTQEAGCQSDRKPLVTARNSRPSNTRASRKSRSAGAQRQGQIARGVVGEAREGQIVKAAFGGDAAGNEDQR